MNATQPRGKVSRSSLTDQCNASCWADAPQVAPEKAPIAQNCNDCKEGESCDGNGSCGSGKCDGKVKASNRNVSSLKRVMRYENNAVVDRIMKELKLTEELATQLFRDTLKFLWLAGKFGGVVPSPLVDEGWHTFLLFTMDYQKFCHKYFGQFIHHRPRRPEDKPDGGKLRNRTHALISEHLGESLSQNWDYKKLAKGDCEQSCAPSKDCNGGDRCR